MVWTGSCLGLLALLVGLYERQDQLYLVALFLVSARFCFLAEVSASMGGLGACRPTLRNVPGILPCLFVLAGQKVGFKSSVHEVLCPVSGVCSGRIYVRHAFMVFW